MMFSITKRGAGRAAAGIFGTALAATGLGVTTAGQASAAASDCPADALCQWDDTNFAGSALFGPLPDRDYPSGSCLNTGAWNDRTASIVNNTVRNIIFYVEGGCTGDFFILPPGGRVANVAQVANFAGDFTGKISSFRV